MSKKQTSIEWLEKNISLDMHPFDLLNCFNKAKAMHKEEIMEAFGVGCHHESKRLVGYQDVAEQYYTETYGDPPPPKPHIPFIYR